MQNFFRKWGWYLLLGAGVAFAAFLLVGRKNAAKASAAGATPGATPGAPEYIPTTGDSYTNENINSNNSTVTQNATAPNGNIVQQIPGVRPNPQPVHMPSGPTGPAQPINPGVGPLPVPTTPVGRPVPPIGPAPPIGPINPPPIGPSPIGPVRPLPPIGPSPIGPGGPPMPPDGGVYNGGISQGVYTSPVTTIVPPAQPNPPTQPVPPAQPNPPPTNPLPDWKLQAIQAWERHVSPPGKHYRWGGPPGSFPAGWGQYPNAPGAANEPRPGVYTWVTPLG